MNSSISDSKLILILSYGIWPVILFGVWIPSLYMYAIYRLLKIIEKNNS